MLATWVLCLSGWIFVYTMPDVYESKAKFFVDQKSRVDELIEKSVRAEDVEAQLNLVRQSLLGRPILEKLARETDLDHRAETPKQFRLLIDSLGEKIVIADADPRRNGSDKIYELTYRDSDPAMSLAVVQKMLDIFIEDVIQSGRSDAENAVVILREQINKREVELRRREQALADFKRENVGLLPGEAGSYFVRLQTEMQDLQDLESQLAVATSRRDTLLQQLRREDPVINSDDALGTSLPGSEIEQRISDLGATLDSLLLNYTEKHPVVVATKEQLAQLQLRRELEVSQLTESGGLEGVPLSNNPIYQQIQIALNEANVEIASVEGQVTARRRSVRNLQAKVDVIPQIEAKLEDLTRDYDQVKGIYDELRQTLERETLRIEIGDREELVFRIIDPPSVSLGPVAPKRSLLLLGVLIAALGAGGGLAYLMHQGRPVFVDIDELREGTGMPVLGAVRVTWLDRHKAERRIEASSLVTAASLLVGVFVVVLLFQDAGGILLRDFIHGVAK